MAEQRIVLIVTGKLEQDGLGEALKRVFPSSNVVFETLYVDGFTSTPVQPDLPAIDPHPMRRLTSVEKMAKALVAAFRPGRRGTPADMAIAIDDLELANAHQPEVVVGLFRKAMERILAEEEANSAQRGNIREVLRRQGSFHLLVPMIEAYFFRDDSALRAAGTVRAASPELHGQDLEAFTIQEDTDYLNAPDKTFYWARPRPGRDRHPKEYLKYLRHPEANPARRQDEYKETRDGVAALQALDWATPLNSEGRAMYLRALLHDIAFFLGVPDPFPGVEAELTRLVSVPHNVLRNLSGASRRRPR